VHGFTGQPDGWKKLIPAILPDSNVIAPALPDTKSVKGFGLNKLIYITASLWGKKINRSDCDMGHDKDVEAICEQIPQKPFIAYGMCRGGSALINTIAKHNPQHLQALVIEAAYASYPKILYGFLSSYGISTKYAESFAKFLFPAYEIGSVSCQKAIPFIKNKDLPILIMHSKDDATIPFAHSLMLYKAFKDNGFTNVYLAELQGQHAYSLRDDQKAYLTAIHSFYKKHNLPYEAEYATADMESYTPDVARITQKLTIYYDGIKKDIQRNRAEMYNSSVGKLIIAAARLQKQSSIGIKKS
jgi:dienelactone hydrolase